MRVRHITEVFILVSFVPLYTIPKEKGSYGTGALGNVNTLGQYVRTLARTIGHYRGEGSCDSKEVK
jgi:hypothetical protein